MPQGFQPFVRCCNERGSALAGPFSEALGSQTAPVRTDGRGSDQTFGPHPEIGAVLRSSMSDAHLIKFQCPQCRQELEQSIASLKQSTPMRCNGCSVGINIDTDRLANAAEEIRRALEKVPPRSQSNFSTWPNPDGHPHATQDRHVRPTFPAEKNGVAARELRGRDRRVIDRGIVISGLSSRIDYDDGSSRKSAVLGRDADHRSP
jgi:predicted RNA-binding Zn-ribbon protein involved in translation (DUF1610 family)